jgi:hypothetical protein
MHRIHAISRSSSLSRSARVMTIVVMTCMLSSAASVHASFLIYTTALTPSTEDVANDLTSIDRPLKVLTSNDSSVTMLSWIQERWQSWVLRKPTGIPASVESPSVGVLLTWGAPQAGSVEPSDSHRRGVSPSSAILVKFYNISLSGFSRFVRGRDHLYFPTVPQITLLRPD